MNKPFLPADLKENAPLALWRRHAVAKGLAFTANRTGDRAVDEFARQLWGEDAAGRITRAAVAPASTGGWGGALIGNAVGEYLGSLRGLSAAARLFSIATRVDLAGAGNATFPSSADGFPPPVFVAEGAPIPVIRGQFDAVMLGPAKKLAFISALTDELATYSAEAAETTIATAMDEAAATALDGAVFAATAASSIRPAGLLNGLTAIPATSGGGGDAMIADVQTLVGAIAAAGGGARIMIFASPRQAVALGLRAAPGFDVEVVPVPALAAGTVIALDAGAIVSGFDGLPTVDTATQTVLHMEDSTPLPVSTAGTPATVAAPLLSTFQTTSRALRSILRCAWAVRRDGMVQVVTGATW